MEIRRIVPDISSDYMAESKKFYTDFLGLDLAMDLGWIMTFISPSHPTAQISVLEKAKNASVQPDLSIEVDDVDSAHARAQARGLKIVYPLTDEPWGVRRFFVSDPNGKILNIVSHRQGD